MRIPSSLVYIALYLGLAGAAPTPQYFSKQLAHDCTSFDTNRLPGKINDVAVKTTDTDLAKFLNALLGNTGRSN